MELVASVDVVTSIGEFERTYGDRQQMQFEGSSPTHNFLWHGARAFFEEGGTRLYISGVGTIDRSDPARPIDPADYKPWYVPLSAPLADDGGNYSGPARIDRIFHVNL